MQIVQGLILLVLLFIFFQDIICRSVYWFSFPVLAVLLTWLHWQADRNFAAIWTPSLINIGFLIFQLLLVTIYFSIKHKKLVYITNELLGLGDVLFLLCISFYLSVLNFIIFYIISIVIVLLTWIVWQSLSPRKSKQIPLAGLQALVFAAFLTTDWYWLCFKLTDDNWLITLMNK